MGACEDPTFEKFVNSENAEGPKNQPCKNGPNGFRKFNLGHGDLDMAPNFDADALVIVPDHKNIVFDPKMLKKK